LSGTAVRQLCTRALARGSVELLSRRFLQGSVSPRRCAGNRARAAQLGPCDKKNLLKKAYDALPSSGTLIVYERLIDDERRVNAVGLLASLQMLLASTGGFDFTGADCLGWMRETGFRDIRVEPLTADQSMVFGIKWRLERRVQLVTSGF